MLDFRGVQHRKLPENYPSLKLTASGNNQQFQGTGLHLHWRLDICTNMAFYKKESFILPLYSDIWEFPKMVGFPQQPWVFLLTMMILGCFGGTPI